MNSNNASRARKLTDKSSLSGSVEEVTKGDDLTSLELLRDTCHLSNTFVSLTHQ